MEGSGQSLSSNSSDFGTCQLHKETITSDKEPYEVLSFLTPLDSRVWTERSDEWNFTYRVYSWFLAAVYLVLGVVAVVMIYKKDCARLKAKTFLAVYTSIAILGFSRFLFFALDPYGLVGFIRDRFDRWIIISRLFAAFGFPSLVASYSLMFLTILKIAKASVNRQWYQYWKFVAPITAIPYIIALSAELIGNTAPYPALISVLVCEAFFTFWGIMICIVYLFAGVRLLRRIRRQERKTVRVHSYHGAYADEHGDDIGSTREERGRGLRNVPATRRAAELRRQPTQFENQEYLRRHNNISKTTRKISIITYATASLGLVYSVFSAANVIVISFFIFNSCLGYSGRGNSTVWLAIVMATRTSEIPLALVMLYSITDISSALAVIKGILCCHCCRTVNKMRNTECRGSTGVRVSSSSLQLVNMHKNSSESSLLGGSRVLETKEDDIEVDTPRETPQEGALEPEQDSNVVTMETQTDTHQEADFITVHVETHTERDTNSVPNSIAVSEPPRVYLLNAQGNSEVSINSDGPSNTVSTSQVTVTTETSTQTTGHIDKAVQTEQTMATSDPSNSGAVPGFKPVPKPRRKRKQHHIVANSASSLRRFARKFTI